MKSKIIRIGFAVLVVGAIALAFNQPTVCERTLHYSVGTIDPRFHISREEVQNVLSGVETVWEKPFDRNLFEYDPNASFTIDFVFDERQQQTIESDILDKHLNQLDAQLSTKEKEYQTRSDQYDAAVASYEARLKQYNTDASAYAKEVAYWNRRGGAPDDVYNTLVAEQTRLNNESTALQVLQQKLDSDYRALDALYQSLSAGVTSYNSQVDTYNQRYGNSNEFTQAEYLGHNINVYQFNDTDELRLALAHEFGHALGIEHVENSRSIMYYLMRDQDVVHPTLTEEDKNALKTICGLK